MKLTGHIRLARLNTGSRHEHVAAVIEADGKRYTLRYPELNPFDTTPFQEFVGHKVHLTGRLVEGGVLLVQKIVLKP